MVFSICHLNDSLLMTFGTKTELNKAGLYVFEMHCSYVSCIIWYTERSQKHPNTTCTVIALFIPVKQYIKHIHWHVTTFTSIVHHYILYKYCTLSIHWNKIPIYTYNNTLISYKLICISNFKNYWYLYKCNVFAVSIYVYQKIGY